MSSPQSFMVGSAPQGAGYAGRLMDFGMLSNLGGDYYAGQQARRANAAATAFPNGVPIDPKTGQPDVNAILDTGAKTGGLPFLQGLLPFLMGGEGAPEPGYNTGGAAPQPQARAQPQGPAPSTPSDNHPAGASPANLRAAGGMSVNRIVSEAGGDPDTDGQFIAKRMNVKAEANLDPTRVQLAKALMTRRSGGQQPDQTQSPLAGDTTETSINGTGTSPRTGEGAGGTVSGAPGPIATPPGSRVAQAFEDSTGGAGTKSVRTQRVPPLTAPQSAAEARAPAPPQAGGRDAEPRAPNVPTGMTNDQAIQDLNARAAARRDAAKRIALINPGRAQIIEKQAESLEKQRDQIVDFQGKFRERTGPEKEAITSGTGTPLLQEREKLRQEGLVKESTTKYNAVDAAARQYGQEQEHYVTLAGSLLNDPKMVSGFGAKAILDINRLRERLGGDPDPAILQMALKKITASDIQAQMNAMKFQLQESGAQGATRIFAQTADLMAQASNDLSNTIGGNRFLTELERRKGEMHLEIGDQAREYRRTHGGVLDDGWDTQISKYISSHPLFTEMELSHPAMLGAPTVPPQYAKNPALAAQWVRDMGLGENDPVRVRAAGGSPKYVHAGAILRIAVPVSFGQR